MDQDEFPPIPPRPNTARQVAVDAFMQLDEEERMFLMRLAVQICDLVHAGEMVYMTSYQLTNDEELAIWSLLPSRIRTKLKAMQ